MNDCLLFFSLFLHRNRISYVQKVILPVCLYPVIFVCFLYILYILYITYVSSRLHVFLSLLLKYTVTGWQINKYGALIEGHDGRNPVPLQLYSPQTSHGPTWEWNRASTVRGWPLTASLMTWLHVIILGNFSLDISQNGTDTLPWNVDQSINQSFIFHIILYRQNQRFGNGHKIMYKVEVLSTTK